LLHLSTSGWGYFYAQNHLALMLTMNTVSDIMITGSASRPMASSLFLPDAAGKCPVIIYAHGFNGFKDWGNFSRIAKPLTDAGFAVLTFNFSLNGTTPDSPEDFTDLEAFGNNNYTRQLFDLDCAIEWVSTHGLHRFPFLDIGSVYLIGHSMGGGMVILKAASDTRVKRVVSWASVSQCNTPWGKWTKPMMDNWKRDGVAFYENKRTSQQMPLYWQLYEDYINHSEQLDILMSAKSLSIPFLICHGLQDPSVPVENAYLLKMAQPDASIFITDGDHVFDRRHPAESIMLPPSMQAVLERTISFLKE
jgi:dienelactone hydrolase